MGPCEWPMQYANCVEGSVYPEPLNSLPASGVAMYEDVAKEFLWNWTGKVYGVCEITINPCKANCQEGRSSFFGSGPQMSMGLSGLWTPVLVDGLWYNIGCGRCGDKCGCGGEASLVIPGPIQEVVSVTEDGEVLETSSYYVQNSRELVRTDGKRWSECGLEITYKIGTPVPVGGQVAAARLATEFAKAACGQKCELPQRVQTVARQGVTIAMLDAFDDIDKGHTGIWVIDSWVASVTKSPVQSRVLSPDLPRSRYRRKTL